jgi:hypothetical protein
MMLGLWIPGMVVHTYDFSVPDGYNVEAHPEWDFFRIVKCGIKNPCPMMRISPADGTTSTDGSGVPS